MVFHIVLVHSCISHTANRVENGPTCGKNAGDKVITILDSRVDGRRKKKKAPPHPLSWLDPQPYAAAAEAVECTERIVSGTLLHTTVVHYHTKRTFPC